MRVLQIQRSDYAPYGGGGAIAMHRLRVGLIRAGIDTKTLCRYKTLESSGTIEISRSSRLNRLELLLGKVTSRFGLNDIHAISSFGIKENKIYLDADVLDFHGVHSGFFSYLALPRLTESKPAVFTLHDMWAFTGHCAYSYDCVRWEIGCGNCPYLDAHPAIKRDGTHAEWKLKNRVYDRSNLVFVTPSNWLAGVAEQSTIHRFPVYQIPYGIDIETYQPLDPERCRSLLGIPPGKKALMFAALRLNHFRKGGDLLLKSLQGLPESLKAETVLLLIGDGGEVISETVGIQTLNLGYTTGDRFKAIAYSAADLSVCPTRADNLPLVLLESMACGTPMVSFNVGGVPELVRPGVTGYLAEPENAKDLCAGIVQLLDDEPLRNYMSQQCRAIALKEYCIELQVQRYTELYCQLLQDSVAQNGGGIGQGE